MVDTEPAVPDRSPGHAEPGSLGAESGPVRGRDAAGGPGPGDRGRRLGQDPGAHAPPRVPRRRARRVAVRDPRDHVHQQGRGRDARAGRRAASARSATACGCRRSTPRARASCAARRRCSATGRASRSTTRPTRTRLTDWVRRDLNLDPKRFPARQLHAQISALKNELILPAEYAADGGRSGRAPHRRGLHGVPAPAGRGVGRRLRRPARAHGAPVPRAPRGAVPLPAALPARPRRRVPGHERRAVGARAPARARAPQHHGRRRRRAERLQVPRRRLPQPVEVRGRVPRGDDRRARPELPVDAAHPRSGERGDREQRVDAARSISGPTRASASRSSATRATTSTTRPQFVVREIHRLVDGGRAPLRRHRRLLPHERAEPRARRVARAFRRAVPRVRRREVLRPARDQGRARVSPRAGESRRRGVVEAHRQHAAARRRRHVDREDRLVRARRGHHVPRPRRARRPRPA